MSNHPENSTDLADSAFHLSSSPVVTPAQDEGDSPALESDLSSELPRSYAQPIVFAMARDPKTLFVYWDIDWPQIFAANAPADRLVYLRVYDDADAELNQITVEPMARHCEVPVKNPGGFFRVEMGYFDRDQKWQVAGSSEIVETPPDKIGALAPGDFALVPFHITFQRLTELFRATRTDEGSLVQSLTRLQEKSLHPEQFGSLAPEEREVYRAMKASTSERTYLPRIPLDRANEMRLQKKLESVLGFGAARPSSSSLGGSSRAG